MGAGLHICHVFNEEAERRSIMAQFLEQGVRDGEKSVCLCDSITPEEMYVYLDEQGVDLSCWDAGLLVKNAYSSYCPDGHFDHEKMLSLLRQYNKTALQDGFAGLRVTGEASWALRNQKTDIDELMQYEAKVNHLIEEQSILACCQYDARLFSGETIMDVLSVHPMMIVRGQLVHNPFYIDPLTFLKEYHARIQEA